MDALGQSFTPTDGGPDGESAPPDTPLLLKQIIFKLQNFVNPDEPVWAFVYAIPLTSASEIGQQEGQLGKTVGGATGGSGTSGASQVVFDFTDPIWLNSNDQYFIYFSKALFLRIRDDHAYNGGAFWDEDFTCDPESTAVFSVTMESEN